MRKFFGVILLIIGYIIALSSLISFISQIIKAIFSDYESIHKISYLFGTLIGFGILGGLSYFIIRAGIKFTKKKKVNDLLEKINSIK